MRVYLPGDLVGTKSSYCTIIHRATALSYLQEESSIPPSCRLPRQTGRFLNTVPRVATNDRLGVVVDQVFENSYRFFSRYLNDYYSSLGLFFQFPNRGEKKWQRFAELVIIPRNRRALVYAVTMVFLGQMTGVNAIMYNMANLMGRIGFDDKKSVLMSLVGGGSLFLGTIPAVLWMDRFGRRVWAQNIVVFFLGLCLVGGGYLIDVEVHRPAALGVYFTGMILYMGFFGSYACVTWVLPAESFDLRTRAEGMAICSTSLYLWSFIVTYNFSGMKNAFTYTGLTMGFYGGIAWLGFFYQLLCMPETKDKTLEEIDDLFSISTMDLIRHNLSNLKRGRLS